jgi:hypothetical protein
MPDDSLVAVTELTANPEPKKWANVSAFMMKFASLQFYITMAIIIFEGFVVWLGVHLPTGIAMSEYLALVGIVHGFLGTIVAFWLANDQRKRELEAKGSGNGQ